MKFFRFIRFWLAVATFAFLAVAGWISYDRYRHRIIVSLPDGSAAEAVEVSLDYDPVYDYHPTRLYGSDGVVFIPRKQAYGRGWEWMSISARRDGKDYYAHRWPSECRYPLRITLEEPPPQPSKLRLVVELLEFADGVRKWLE